MEFTVVCWLYNVYLHIIDCLLIKTVITTFKLTRILLKTTLLMTQQLQFGCCDICIATRSWILWNYSLVWINIITVYHIGVIFDTIGYFYTSWVIVNAIHSNCNHKLHIIINGRYSYTLDQNKTIRFTLNKNITIVFMIVNYCKSISYVHKMCQLYQIGNKIQNFKYNCYIGMILNMIDKLPTNFGYKAHTNGSDGYELKNNSIIQYTLVENKNTTLTIINYDQFVTEIYEMDQFYRWFYPIDDVKHNLDLVVTIINVIDIISSQIKILVAIYSIICRTWLSIFTYDTLVLLCKLMTIHSRIISLSTLYLTTINMDNFKVSISISNVITKIMAQTDHMDVVLIIIAITTVMTIHNWIQRELMYVNSMKVEIFDVFIRNETIAITVIHYDKLNTNTSNEILLCNYNYNQ